MTIFVIDTDIRRCARAHCARHVSKMILESVQLLCTALNKVPGDAVAAYRRFYFAEKASFATWTRRAPPAWRVRDAA